MTWQKGESGNPNGAPQKKRQQLEELLLPHVQKAVNTLVECLSDPDEKLTASRDIIDRMYGKATQNTNISGELNIPITVNIGEKRRD